MTENEAIEILKNTTEHTKVYEDDVVFTSDFVKAYEMAINALSEIQPYRAIGTVEGYENAIKAYTETYILMKEYKSKLKDFEAIGTIDEFKALKKKQKYCLGYRSEDGIKSPQFD